MEQQMKIIADAVNEIMRQTLADRDEIERLREALQWAIKDCDAKTNHETIKRELLEALREKE